MSLSHSAENDGLNDANKESMLLITSGNSYRSGLYPPESYPVTATPIIYNFIIVDTHRLHGIYDALIFQK